MYAAGVLRLPGVGRDALLTPGLQQRGEDEREDEDPDPDTDADPDRRAPRCGPPQREHSAGSPERPAIP